MGWTGLKPTTTCTSRTRTADVNRTWATSHPAAVEDFLRATFEAFGYCRSHAQACVEDAAKHEAGYDVHQNVQRWEIESGDVMTTLLPGHGLGYEDLAQWQPEYQLLKSYKLIKGTVDLGSIINPNYVEAIYRGRKVLWP